MQFRRREDSHTEHRLQASPVSDVVAVIADLKVYDNGATSQHFVELFS
jgi:hypothetical protein